MTDRQTGNLEYTCSFYLDVLIYLSMITSDKKQAIVADFGKNEKDSGDPSVQVGILTARIKELTEHLKVNKKDHMARRGLLQLVGKRKKLLRYISEQNTKRYLTLIKQLGIRR